MPAKSAVQQPEKLSDDPQRQQVATTALHDDTLSSNPSKHFKVRGNNTPKLWQMITVSEQTGGSIYSVWDKIYPFLLSDDYSDVIMKTYPREYEAATRMMYKRWLQMKPYAKWTEFVNALISVNLMREANMIYEFWLIHDGSDKTAYELKCLRLCSDYSLKLEERYNDLERVKQILILQHADTFITKDHQDNITKMDTYSRLLEYLSGIFKDLESFKGVLDNLLNENGVDLQRNNMDKPTNVLMKRKKYNHSSGNSSMADSHSTDFPGSFSKSSSSDDKESGILKSAWNYLCSYKNYLIVSATAFVLGAITVLSLLKFVF